MNKKRKPGKSSGSKGKDKARKDKKQERPKVVRDSFTMPEDDYAKMRELKARCLSHGVHVKKGELLRAGLYALENLNKEQLLEILDSVERVKTGRPKTQED